MRPIPAGYFSRRSPDDIRVRENRTTFPPPGEPHPLCVHPMARTPWIGPRLKGHSPTFPMVRTPLLSFSPGRRFLRPTSRGGGSPRPLNKREIPSNRESQLNRDIRTMCAMARKSPEGWHRRCQAGVVGGRTEGRPLCSTRSVPPALFHPLCATRSSPPASSIVRSQGRWLMAES